MIQSRKLVGYLLLFHNWEFWLQLYIIQRYFEDLGHFVWLLLCKSLPLQFHTLNIRSLMETLAFTRLYGRTLQYSLNENNQKITKMRSKMKNDKCTSNRKIGHGSVT